jgi:hypothetical protein
MNTIDFAKQAKMRELIALLDQAIEMGQDLNDQINEIGRILEERSMKQAA